MFIDEDILLRMKNGVEYDGDIYELFRLFSNGDDYINKHTLRIALNKIGMDDCEYLYGIFELHGDEVDYRMFRIFYSTVNSVYS